jgi:hypothetical protein
LSICAQREQQRQLHIQKRQPEQQQRSSEKNKNKKEKEKERRKNEMAGDAIRMTEGELRAAAARQMQFEHELQQQQHELQEAASHEDDSATSSPSHDAAAIPLDRQDDDGSAVYDVGVPAAAVSAVVEPDAAAPSAMLARAAPAEAGLYMPQSASVSVSVSAGVSAAPTPAPACSSAARPLDRHTERQAHSTLVVEMGAGDLQRVACDLHLPVMVLVLTFACSD